ncbi:uncharacterized protein LOC135016457 [Pseudophryne corroboree]|uniref:uncharacterized protein LOC135016457 n=1 Tax=Pseudophryne corroboree TaxID=495146 RepID=UPI00308203DC
MTRRCPPLRPALFAQGWGSSGSPDTYRRWHHQLSSGTVQKAPLRRQRELPSTEKDWLNIADDFNERWNFPNCGGAIDGKHIRIIPPVNSGSLYHNYKGYFSVVMMAIVDANYNFLYVDVGKNGRASDGGSFKDTLFYERLVSRSLELPPASHCTNGLNFVFVADEAFALHEHVMKPYPKRGLTTEKRVYNYRLSRARRTVENAFGILSNRFRIFHTAINLRVDKINWVVLACCALHNLLRKKKMPPRNPARPEPTEIVSNTCFTPICRPEATVVNPTDAKRVREEYLAYFNGEGAVAWQYEMI